MVHLESDAPVMSVVFSLRAGGSHQEPLQHPQQLAASLEIMARQTFGPCST
tara:strand:+ start:5835 stop:5987 length:153 start_codon:yes stop_codon:yes gene_type:complete